MRQTLTSSPAGTTIVGIPSRDGTTSKTPAGRASASGGVANFVDMTRGRREQQDEAAAGGLELRLRNLLLQLNDPVDQRLGPGRAARHEHVDRHHLVDALDDGVVVEHAA